MDITVDCFNRSPDLASSIHYCESLQYLVYKMRQIGIGDREKEVHQVFQLTDGAAESHDR